MNLYEVLESLNISFKEYSHEPVYTVKEAQKLNLEGFGCKNLFLKDKKKYYLVIIPEEDKADLKELSKMLETSKLSFASALSLKEILDLEQGSVTPFGIINDKENQVLILIDQNLENKILLFHPNVNTKTIALSYQNLIKFIEYENHDYLIF